MHPLEAKRDALRRQVAAQKRQIRQLRIQLGMDAQALADLDAQCHRLGLGYHPVQIGVEETHGRPPS